MATCHRKINSLSYTFIPFVGIYSFKLNYRYKKHIPVIITADQMSLNWKLQLTVRNFKIKYAPYKPIGIGYRVDFQGIHKHYVNYQLSKINILKYTNKVSLIKKFFKLWLESLFINTILLILSFLKINFYHFEIEAPKLHYDNKIEDLPDLKFAISHATLENKISKDAKIKWLFVTDNIRLNNIIEMFGIKVNQF